MTTGAVSDEQGEWSGHPRPASRRGRARVRAVAAPPNGSRPPAGAGTDLPDGAAVAPAPPGRPRQRRTRREVRRRRAALLASMGALSVAGAALAVVGVTTVRNSTLGRYDTALAPTEPGYQAYVVPTPTMAALQVGSDGSLVSLAVLSLEPGDRGGGVIVVPPSAVVPADPDTAAPAPTLAEVYRDQGAAATVAALAQVVTVGVSDYVVVDDAHWSRLVAPVAPVEVTLDQPVGDWPAGAVAVPAADVGRFLAAEGDGETDIDRLDRQQQFWGAWLARIGDAGEDAVPGEVDTGLGRFVRGIAQGPTTAAALPVLQDDTSTAAAQRLTPESPQLEALVTRAVPFPVAPGPGRRIRVRLLNGTADPSLTQAAAPTLVEAGAEITIVGNAPSFDVAHTTVAYAGSERSGIAAWLAAKSGIGRIEEVSAEGDAPLPSPDDEIDVTVILGADARELTRR